MKNLHLDVVERRGNSNTTPLQNASYTKQELPISGSSGKRILVTDGTINGTPTMAYFYDGKWHRVSDDSVIKNQTIDIYLLAGQSNAHGHYCSNIRYPLIQLSQDGLFYTSWHNNTSNASTQQYYSDWASSLFWKYQRKWYLLLEILQCLVEIGFVA